MSSMCSAPMESITVDVDLSVLMNSYIPTKLIGIIRPKTYRVNRKMEIYRVFL